MSTKAKTRIQRGTRTKVALGMGAGLLAAMMAQASPALAASPAITNVTLKSISLNGARVIQAYGFTYNQTAYIPIWYVFKALTAVGVQSTWDGTNWRMTVPANIPINFSNVSVGTGSKNIYLNGRLVKKIDAIVYKDPMSGKPTTYMPIWYVMKILERINVKSSWDGTHWVLTTANQYTAYKADGSVIGSFPQLSDAEKAVQNLPGGYVKDPSGNAAFQEPDFAAYRDPSQTPKHFTSESAADASIKGYPNGFVVDAITGIVTTLPSNYYQLDGSGRWTNSIDGPLGSQKPPFAQPGVIYVGIDPNPGHSPYNTKFYALSQGGKFLGKYVGTWESPYRTADLRFPAPWQVNAQSIDAFLASHNSPMQGLGASFIAAQNTYGVNATYLLAHAIEESAWGTSTIAHAKNNLFGYGAYDTEPMNAAGSFPSEDYAIRFEAWEVRNNYLNPGSSHFYNWPTLDGMNEHYATAHDWASNIATIMDQFVTATGGNASQYTQYSGQSAPPPSSTDEPVYYLNGATVTKNLPFPGNLSISMENTYSPAVQQVQNQLNQDGFNVGYADGYFGPKTQAGVMKFQAAQNLPQTGVVDQATWNTLFPSQGPEVTIPIDRMRQGYNNGYVTEMYHLADGSDQWIYANTVHLGNVFRVNAANGVSTQVYDPNNHGAVIYTLHDGDYVVVTNSVPTAGYYTIQLCDQSTGKPMTGVISTNDATIQQVY